MSVLTVEDLVMLVDSLCCCDVSGLGSVILCCSIMRKIFQVGSVKVGI